MKIRAIPFGYKYDVGQIVVDETAACVVKEIFKQYINGNSLLNISSLLNNMNIEYRPGVVGWNKARIKRIIEDKRYLGNQDYPTIISEDLSEKANTLKSGKNTQSNIDKDNMIYSLEATVCCPCCGNIMKRIFEPRNKIPERWRCERAGCHRIIPISDVDLLSEIQALFNSIISNPELITPSDSENQISIKTQRAENEINRLFDSRNPNKDQIRGKLIEAVSLQYGDIDTAKYESQWLRDLFLSQAPFKKFPLELFNQTVNTISFDGDESVTVTLINGQTVGKGPSASAKMSRTNTGKSVLRRIAGYPPSRKNKSTVMRFRRDTTQKKSMPNRNGSSSKSLLTKAFPVQAPSTVTNSIK